MSKRKLNLYDVERIVLEEFDSSDDFEDSRSEVVCDSSKQICFTSESDVGEEMTLDENNENHGGTQGVKVQ